METYIFVAELISIVHDLNLEQVTGFFVSYLKLCIACDFSGKRITIITFIIL